MVDMLSHTGYLKNESMYRGSTTRERFDHINIRGMYCEYSVATGGGEFPYAFRHYDGGETKAWTSDTRDFNLNEIGSYLRQYFNKTYGP